jgi:hypothetical protein
MSNRSSHRFEPLGGVLSGEARRLKLDRSLREAAALLLWPEVVGEQIAGATQAERVQDGILYVVARSSTWAFELTFHRDAILKGLNARLGAHSIREIRFRSGVLPDPASLTPTAPKEPLPSAAELEALVLPPDETEAVEREAAAIPDPEMQAVVRRLLTNERKRAVWRAAHGFRECTACGALYTGPQNLCPACRSEAGR